jgi:hypothetical protein
MLVADKRGQTAVDIFATVDRYGCEFRFNDQVRHNCASGSHNELSLKTHREKRCPHQLTEAWDRVIACGNAGDGRVASRPARKCSRPRALYLHASGRRNMRTSIANRRPDLCYMRSSGRCNRFNRPSSAERSAPSTHSSRQMATNAHGNEYCADPVRVQCAAASVVPSARFISLGESLGGEFPGNSKTSFVRLLQWLVVESTRPGKFPFVVSFLLLESCGNHSVFRPFPSFDVNCPSETRGFGRSSLHLRLWSTRLEQIAASTVVSLLSMYHR